MTSEMPETSNHVIAATTDVGQLRARVAELEAECTDYERKITTLQQRLDDALTRVFKAEQQLAERDAVIEGVRDPIDSYADLLSGDCTPEEMLLKRAAKGLRALLPTPPKGGDDGE